MHIREATRNDLADIASVAAAAMMTDELSLWLSPCQKAKPDVFRQRNLQMTKRRWNNGHYMLVMVLDEDDAEWAGKPTIIAYAAYEKEIGAVDDSSKRKSSFLNTLERYNWHLIETYNYYTRNNLGTIPERLAEVGRETDASEACNRFERFWSLSLLAVDPAYWRRGIGSKLIAWGKLKAIEDKVPLWLWSSVKGQRLYLREGFEKIGTLTFGGGVLSAPVMAWYPDSVRPVS